MVWYLRYGERFLIGETMAIIKIEEVYLYATLDHTHAECYEMKKWLDDNNVNYTYLHYHAEAKNDALAPLNTWWEGVTFTDFPIIIYTEVRDDVPLSQSPRRYFTTLADAQASEFLTHAPRK